MHLQSKLWDLQLLADQILHGSLIISVFQWIFKAPYHLNQVSPTSSWILASMPDLIIGLMGYTSKSMGHFFNKKENKNAKNLVFAEEKIGFFKVFSQPPLALFPHPNINFFIP